MSPSRWPNSVPILAPVSSQPITARIADGVASIRPAEWDACAGTANPFVGHAFLSLLERSGSATARAGWQPLPIVIDGAGGCAAGIAPAYVKAHSQGEYVFDHGWADAWERAGGNYYPKLQVAVPFTPVPGPRLLLREPALAPSLIAAIEAVTDQNGLSSAHVTFVETAQLHWFETAGWLVRAGTQFHWQNHDYARFDDFLAALSSRKRKAIRKERAAALEGLTVRHLTGTEITEAHWDAFWEFYQDTGSRKWGRPYLTREFFSLLGEEMADKVLLIFAERDGVPIAGALNLIGEDALYGRYWGAMEHIPCLHFETAYYQPLEFCIANGIQTFEGGFEEIGRAHV